MLDLAPAEVAARLRHLPGLAFFDTAKCDGDAGALSVIAAAPREILRGHISRDWDTLRTALARRECAHGDDGLPHGIAAGRVDYDGTFCFGLYDDTLIFRHAEQRWYGTGDLVSQLAENPAPAHCARPNFRSAMPRENFLAMVRRAQDYIAAGDIYQVNLSHRFASAWSGEPWAFYEALRRMGGGFAAEGRGQRARRQLLLLAFFRRGSDTGRSGIREKVQGEIRRIA